MADVGAIQFHGTMAVGGPIVSTSAFVGSGAFSYLIAMRHLQNRLFHHRCLILRWQGPQNPQKESKLSYTIQVESLIASSPL